MSNKCPARGVRYDNDEDKMEGRKKAYSKYSSIYWTCDLCNTAVRNGNKSRHMETKKHKNNVKLKGNKQ